MRHYARAGRKLIGQRDKAKVLAHIHAHVHGEMAQSRSYSRYGKGDGTLCLAAAHLSGDNIVMQIGEMEKFGCLATVERERRAIAGCRTERILICDVVGG